MKKIVLSSVISLIIGLIACSDQNAHKRGVYLLLDTSGTYTEEINKGQNIINYLLANLNPGDSMAVARIDSGSFSERDIIAKVTFDTRPTTTNAQKRSFQQTVNNFVNNVKSSKYTDISGGILQAIEYLNETGAGKKQIYIFSDLKEDLKKGHIRDFPFDFSGITVTALNVTKLMTDQIDPREYLSRVETWKAKVESGGGTWVMINDMDRIEQMLNQQD